MNLPRVDAILSFQAGLVPSTELPNKLSQIRLNQVKKFVKESGLQIPILLGGGQVNYQTKVVRSRPSAEVYKEMLVADGLIDEALVISTGKGFCTVTEALSYKQVADNNEWNTLLVNSSLEHLHRVNRILSKVFPKGKYKFIDNPFSGFAGKYMNPQLEELLLDLFNRNFWWYKQGTIPYTGDEEFFREHQHYYYPESIHYVESTRSMYPEQLTAYMGIER